MTSSLPPSITTTSSLPPSITTTKDDVTEKIETFQRIIQTFLQKYGKVIECTQTIGAIGIEHPDSLIECERKMINKYLIRDVTPAYLSFRLLQTMMEQLQLCIDQYDCHVRHNQTSKPVLINTSQCAFQNIKICPSVFVKEWERRFTSIDTYINTADKYIANYMRHSLADGKRKKVTFSLKRDRKRRRMEICRDTANVLGHIL